MHTHQAIECKNCGTSYTGNYCPECGQSSHTGRIDAGYIVHDLPHSLFHIDKGILYTAGQLIIRPGKAIGEYLEGRRAKHFRPFAYLIILTSLAAILSHFVISAIEHKLAVSGVQEHKTAAQGSLNYYIDKVTPFFHKYPSVLFFITIPILSLVTWLFYKKRGFNYWENIVLNTYLTAQFNICLVALYLFVLITGSTGYSFTPWLVVFFLYLGLAYGQFFSYKRKRVNILINLLLMALVTFLYLNAFSFSGLMTPWWGS
jgi:hypothetical protein